MLFKSCAVAVVVAFCFINLFVVVGDVDDAVDDWVWSSGDGEG